MQDAAATGESRGLPCALATSERDFFEQSQVPAFTLPIIRDDGMQKDRTFGQLKCGRVNSIQAVHMI